MDQQTDQVEGTAAAAAGAEAEQEAQQRATEEAALLAGFAQANGEEPPTPTDDDTADKAGKQDDPNDATGGDAPGAADQPTDTDAAATAAAEADVPLTRAQLDELLAQERAAFQAELRKVHGRYGQLNGRLEEVAKRKGLTKEDLAALREEGWDDVADALGKNLPDKHEDLSPLPDLDDESPAPPATTSASDVVLPPEVQDQILNRVSPGWDAKIASPAFATWLGTLPANEAAEIADSNDPLRIADEVARFDKWNSQSQAAAAEAEKAQRLKQQRLTGATQPTRGNTTATLPAEDDEETAMRKAYERTRQGVA